MPSIASRLRPDPPLPPTGALPPVYIQKPPVPPAAPPISSTLRSPLPNLMVMQPDSLRQYYAGGQIPQYRFPPLKPLSH
jgi:hypothetical protein